MYRNTKITEPYSTANNNIVQIITMWSSTEQSHLCPLWGELCNIWRAHISSRNVDFGTVRFCTIALQNVSLYCIWPCSAVKLSTHCIGFSFFCWDVGFLLCSAEHKKGCQAFWKRPLSLCLYLCQCQNIYTLHSWQWTQCPHQTVQCPLQTVQCPRETAHRPLQVVFITLKIAYTAESSVEYNATKYSTLIK